MSDVEPAKTPENDDPYLWLEAVTDETALSWVRARNEESTKALADGERFTRVRDEARQVLDSDDRIPYVTRRGDQLYNFWQDADHPRGLWRRTTLEEYRKDQPEWEILLDVDALNTAEGENWVYKGATVLRPDYDRALIELSRGGADAVVVREFDLPTRAFVPDGFTLPEAKSQVGWIDRDRVYVGTDFGEGSLTSSGYPRIVKEWHRGTSVDEATTVYEGEATDVAVGGMRDHTPGWERDIIRRSVGFFSGQTYLRDQDGTLRRIDVPDDAVLQIRKQWLLIRTRSEWTVDDATYPAGTLLVTELDAWMDGNRELTVLFRPDPHTSLRQAVWTSGHLLLNSLVDVKSRIEVLTPPASGQGEWSRSRLLGVPELEHTDIVGADPDQSDEFWLETTGFTSPTRLLYGNIGEQPEVIKSAPEYFDASEIQVRQHFATSDDGTRIPYFVVGPERSEPAPTLLTAYGGFEIARTPAYSGVLGRSWLARGGTFVLANIRGGGEYGPAWHHAAVREKRPRAYEDLAAVARDLERRGITTPSRLGVQGGSNGGLLTGVMLTRYPELFGAVIIQVPLLDMKRYHRLLAGASWMAEYGDPDNPDDWAFLRTYSPYQNLRQDREYPPTLVMTSTRDDRVHPGHARKMVARMREYGLDVTYYENIEGGHGAAADNSQLAFRESLSYEFLWRRLADN